MNAFQAVVIGAGVNGLAAALNLSAAGMRVLVVERAPQVGGQAVTEESLLPGFKLHPHANYLSYEDLLQSDALAKAMPRNSITPLAQHGLAFRDGRPPLVLYRRELAQKTKQSLSAYSRHDARAFLQMKELANQLTRPLADIYFDPPYAASIKGYAAKVAEVYAGLFDPRQLGTRSAQQLIDSLFESDEVRTLFYRLTLEFSGSLIDAGGDISFLGHVMWLLCRRTLPVCGMGSVSAALAASVRQAGGVIACGLSVRRISVRNGVVDGVYLSDGSFMPADVVVSSVDYQASMGYLLAQQEQPSAYSQVQSNMIGSYGACLSRAPEYRSGMHNADINQCAQVFIGLDSTGEVIEHMADLMAGRLPAPSGAIRVNSLWDASQAPEGRHAAGADCPFPGGLDDDLRKTVEASFPSAFAQTWAEYAPNMRDGILAQHIRLTDDTARKLALREGDEQYRGPVRGYYLCGASTHPGGGVHGACGVNAAKTIRKDFPSL